MMAAKRTEIDSGLRAVKNELSTDVNSTGSWRVDETDCREERRFPRPTGSEQSHDFTTPHLHGSIPHGDDFRVATSVDLGDLLCLDGKRVFHGFIDHERASLGDTFIAFQMPSRLDATEITNTMPAS